MSSPQPLVEITGVDLAEPPAELIRGSSLGRPVTGPQDAVHAGTYSFELLGWVVGEAAPATRVSVAQDGTALWRVPVADARPEVAEMFAGAPGAEHPGFFACVTALVLPHEFELKLTVTLGRDDDRRYAPLGRVRGRRAPLAPADHRFRPLMVTGFGRTGSNVFLRALGEHPEVIAYRPFHTESRVAHYWADVLRELAEPGGYRRQIRPGGVPGRGWWLGGRMPMPWVYHPAEVEHEIGGGPLDEVVALCRHRIESVCERLTTVCDRPQATFLAEKQQPTYVPTMLWDLYPDAREVFLVRDFRDMMASMAALDAKWGGTPRFGRDAVDSEVEHARQFRPWVTDLLAGLDRRSDRAHVVRYEDLMRAPRETMEAVVSYLQIETPAATLDRMADSLHATDQYSDEHRTTAGGEESIGRWQRDLAPDVLEACEHAFGPALERFGYISAA